MRRTDTADSSWRLNPKPGSRAFRGTHVDEEREDDAKTPLEAHAAVSAECYSPY